MLLTLEWRWQGCFVTLWAQNGISPFFKVVTSCQHSLILLSFMWGFMSDCESDQLVLNSFRSTVGALSALPPDNFSSSSNSPSVRLPLRLYWIHSWHFEPGHSWERERVQGWVVWRETTRPHKTFRKHCRHQRGIMPHCGGWMCWIVFVGESGRKREGRQNACDVWSQPDCG